MMRFIMRQIAFAVSITLLSAQMAQAAAEFQYYVFPISGITGISQSAIAASSADGLPKYSGMIDQKYTEIFLDAAMQKNLISYFQKAVVEGFPTSVIGANQVRDSRAGKYAYSPYELSQCSPSFQVGYKDAFAIAVGVSRLSVYFNTYDDFTQVLIPVTYTIRFVKLNGASTVFSKSETIYTQYDTSTKSFFRAGTNEISPEIIVALKVAMSGDAKQAISRLVGDAVKGFSPKQTKALILARDGEYVIFDRGSEIGFASGEQFDAQDDSGKEYYFDVKYTTEKMTVAVASKLSPGAARLPVSTGLTFSFTKQGVDDAKPTVLAVQYSLANEGQVDRHQVIANALQSILADDIGFKAPFNLIKQDADFWRLKNQIKGEANCDSSIYASMVGFTDTTTVRRPDPDFFLKLDHVSSPSYTAIGVGGVTSRTQFASAVSLSLIDKSSIARQVFLMGADYDLARSAGKGLSFEQAEEINLKNASLKAMVALLDGFAPKQKTLKIKALAGRTVTLSEVVSAASFQELRIVRPLSVREIGKTILMPLPASEDGSYARFENPGTDTDTFVVKGKGLQSSDLVILGGGASGNSQLKICDSSRNRLFLSAPLKSPSNVEGLVGIAIGSRIKSFDLLDLDSGFAHSVSSALRSGMFQSEKIVIPQNALFCAVPLELQRIEVNECLKGKCTGSGSVGAGFRVYAGDKKVMDVSAGGKFAFVEVEDGSLSSFFGVKAFQHMLDSVSQITVSIK